LAPNLIARNSIGHIGAAQLLLTAGDKPERLLCETTDAFLRLLDSLPIDDRATIAALVV
jgi:transposase